MSVPLLVEQRDLEACIGPKRVQQLLLDPVTGQVNAALLHDILQMGSDCAAGKLMPGFSEPEIVALFQRDSVLRRHAAWVCVGMAAQGKDEFMTGDGKFLYAEAFAKAEKELKGVGDRSDSRSIAEDQNGTKNRLIGPRVTRTGHPKNFVFADTTCKQGSGGF